MPTAHGQLRPDHRQASGSTEVLGNNRPEFEKPPTDRLIADRQSALSQEILDILVAQGEPEVEPEPIRGDQGAPIMGPRNVP